MSDLPAMWAITPIMILAAWGAHASLTGPLVMQTIPSIPILAAWEARASMSDPRAM